MAGVLSIDVLLELVFVFGRAVITPYLFGEVDGGALSRLTVLVHDFSHFLVVDVLRSLLLHVDRIPPELAHFVVKPRHMLI